MIFKKKRKTKNSTKYFSEIICKTFYRFLKSSLKSAAQTESKKIAVIKRNTTLEVCCVRSYLITILMHRYSVRPYMMKHDLKSDK